MNLIVNDNGFSKDDWNGGFSALNDARPDVGIDLATSSDPGELQGRLDDISIIRVIFPNFSDGRGFTIARCLRLMGYNGRLRAAGHVIADQYAMARRAGFDEIEIAGAIAERQPEADWRFRANWREHDYQSRLRGRIQF
ncbi:MAG: DUF934 domain-containing protein [Roseovarius sp.]|nr:DUF934 domain-containing protein [Roseovarius sp.]MCY4315947.1 DUF934 domain-containing protein [Roseovarius sp.]